MTLQLIPSPTKLDHSLTPPDASADVPAGFDEAAEHTRITVNKKTGLPMVSCNGPICRQQLSQNPLKTASVCMYNFCKKCCMAYQKDGASRCAEAQHNVSVSEVNPAIFQSAEPVELNEYDRNRPFSAVHYAARDAAKRQLVNKTNEVLQVHNAKEALKRSIELFY